MALKTFAMRTHEELRADYKKLSDAVMDIQGAIPQKQRNDRYIEIYKALIRSTIKGHEEKADIRYEHIEFADLILNDAGKNPYSEEEKSNLTAVLKKTFSQLNTVVQKKFFTALHSVEDLTHFVEAGLKGDTILPASVQKAMQKFWEDYTELDYDMLFANEEVTLDRTHAAFEGTEKDSRRRIAHIAGVTEGALEKKPNLYDFHDQHGRRETSDLLAFAIKAVLIGARENADVINDCNKIVHLLRPASGQYTVANNYLDHATLSAKQINPVFNALSDDQLETLLKSLFKYGHLSPALYRGILDLTTGATRFIPLDWQTGIPDETKAVDLTAPEDVYPFLSQRKNPQLPDRVWKIAEKILFGLEPEAAAKELSAGAPIIAKGKELGESPELTALRQQYEDLHTQFEVIQNRWQKKSSPRPKDLQSRLHITLTEMAKQTTALIKILIQATREESPLAHQDAGLIFRHLSEVRVGYDLKNAWDTWRQALKLCTPQERHAFIAALDKFGYLDLLTQNPNIEATATVVLDDTIKAWRKYQHTLDNPLSSEKLHDLIMTELTARDYNPLDWEVRYKDGYYIHNKEGAIIRFEAPVKDGAYQAPIIHWPDSNTISSQEHEPWTLESLANVARFIEKKYELEAGTITANADDEGILYCVHSEHGRMSLSLFGQDDKTIIVDIVVTDLEKISKGRDYYSEEGKRAINDEAQLKLLRKQAFSIKDEALNALEAYHQSRDPEHRDNIIHWGGKLTSNLIQTFLLADKIGSPIYDNEFENFKSGIMGQSVTGNPRLLSTVQKNFLDVFGPLSKEDIKRLFSILHVYGLLAGTLYPGELLTEEISGITKFKPLVWVDIGQPTWFDIARTINVENKAYSSLTKALRKYAHTALPKKVWNVFGEWVQEMDAQYYQQTLATLPADETPQDDTQIPPNTENAEQFSELSTKLYLLVSAELNRKGYTPDDFRIDGIEATKTLFLTDKNMNPYLHPVKGKEIIIIPNDTGIESIDIPDKRGSFVFNIPPAWTEVDFAPITPNGFRKNPNPDENGLRAMFGLSNEIVLNIPEPEAKPEIDNIDIVENEVLPEDRPELLSDLIDIIAVENLLPEGALSSSGVKSRKRREYSDDEDSIPQPRLRWILTALAQDGFTARDLNLYHNKWLGFGMKDHTYVVIQAMNDDHCFQIAVCLKLTENFHDLLDSRKWDELESEVGHATYIMRESIDWETEELQIADLKKLDTVWTAACYTDQQYSARIRHCAYTPLGQLQPQLKTQMGWGGPHIATQVLQTIRAFHTATGQMYRTIDEAPIEHGPLNGLTTPRRLFSSLYAGSIEGLEDIKTKTALLEEAITNSDIPVWPEEKTPEVNPVKIINLKEAFEDAVLYVLVRNELPDNPDLTEALINGNVAGREELGITSDVKLDKDFYVACGLGTKISNDNYEAAPKAVIRQFARLLG